MKDASDLELRVEPLNSFHNRAEFWCGVPELDRYLHDQAGQDGRRKVAVAFVLVDGAPAILGFYSLSAYGIHLGELPEALARKLPRYPIVPATLLGRVAISSSARGRKLGRFLLMDALHKSWKNSSVVASAAVVVEALNQDARAFYLHHEFQPFRDHPGKLFLAMTTIERLFQAR